MDPASARTNKEQKAHLIVYFNASALRLVGTGRGESDPGASVLR